MRRLLRLCGAFAPAAALCLALSSTAVFSSARRAAAPGAVSFSSAQYSVGEADGAATITLTRTGGTDNKIVAKVSLTDVTTSPADYVFATDALNQSFQAKTDGPINASALQPDGKIVIGGRFALCNNVSRNRVARLNADGSLDTTFDPGSGVDDNVLPEVFTLALQPDGKIIIGGFFSSYNGVTRNSVARLNRDGSLDTTFNPGTGADTNVRTAAVQPDGKIVIAGTFNSYNGVARARVARVNSDGSLDTTFDPGSGPDSIVYTSALQPDGKIIIAGDFLNYKGVSRHGTARLNSDGSLDTSFNIGPGVNGGVRTVTLQPDGNIIIGGFFNSYDGFPRYCIARLYPDGSLDGTFNTEGGVDGTVWAAPAQPDGKVVIGGNFTNFSGAPRSTIARVNPNGSLDTTFAPSGSQNSIVRTILIQPDGKIVAAGESGNVVRFGGDLFVTWEAGDASDKTLSLPIVNDSILEGAEDLTLTLTPLSGGATAGTHTTATLTIDDNETAVSNVSGTGVFGGSATLTAKLTASGGAVGGKSISFTLNGSPAGSATTDAAGVATLTNVSLAGVNAGTYAGAVGASFAGDAGLTGSSATGALTVSKADQTIDFPALSDRMFSFADFTISATASSGLSVSFEGVGSCTVSGSTVHLTSTGFCRITAIQFGDSNYNAASVVRGFDVTQASTSVAVSSSANPSAVGQSVTFTAAVTSATGPAPGGILGTVNFFDGSVAIPNCASLLNSGQAACTTAALSPGRHTITAQYGTINPNFTGSTGTLQGGQVVGSLIQFGESSYTAAEGGTLTVTVKRAGDTTQAAGVDYATEDGLPGVPCSSITLQALSRCDYTKALGTLSFAAGETEKTFKLLVGDDSYAEGPEQLFLRLSNPAGGGSLGTNESASVIITDDSPESAGNPIDDETKFVTQHYRDFLNRDPDPEGLAFWVGGITVCGDDAGCREVKRIDTSAAFFLSIEFQETGYLVYRTYKAAHGDATSPNVPGTVPLVRLNDFLTDTQRIGRDVIVNVDDWEARLAANKQAYALEFVQRQRFRSAFPASLTAAQFVDQLDRNAGGVLSADERAQLVASLGAAPADAAKRADALRQVAEHQTLRQRELHRAFVLMQYFGYLRRNPDDAPEAGLNFAGWRFWLDKLEEFNGDYRRAEMVKAFVNSDEYRRRFGGQ